MPTDSSSDPSAGAGTRGFLRRQPLFEGLTDEDLERLEELAGIIDVPAGGLLIEEGAPGFEMYIVMDGELEVSRGHGEQQSVLAVRGVGEVVGEMSMLGRGSRTASVRALRDSRLLVIDREAFRTLLSCSDSAALTIVQTMTSRLRSTEALLMQQEKLAALGTMAAGLAHELNNPAAAIGRAAAHLREGFDRWQAAWLALASAAPAPGAASPADALRELALQGRRAPRGAGAVSWRLEEELSGWLEERGVAAAWEVAPVLAAAGWSADELSSSLDAFAAEQLPGLIRLLAADAEMRQLLDEVGAGAAAVSEIVGAVKSYSYLDQAPVQEVDIHRGLEDTLLILRHKLRGGVEVLREYQSNLPRIEAHGSELSQVWTNLIDNAVDAMSGRGRLRLRTWCHESRLGVEICDDGPGIPSEVQNRIFDPFFTTKPIGAGTGLGLHIVHSVVRRHGGQVRVASQPGSTCFQVTLPLRLPRA